MLFSPTRSRSLQPARRALVCAIGMIASATVVAPISTVAPVVAGPPVEVMAWVPPWAAAGAADSLTKNVGSMSEVTPIYWSARGVSVVLSDTSNAARDKLAAIKASAGTKPIIGTVFDDTRSDAPSGGMATILADPTTRAQHIDVLVRLAVDNGLAGIDLDYENFAFRDARTTWPATFDAWGTFLTELSAALHAQGKLLAVAVPPIVDNTLENKFSNYWVYNWPVMAKVVDKIRVMTYGYSGSTLGQTAPYKWVNDSMNAALKVPGMDPKKLAMGIGAFGNDAIAKIAGSCPANADLKKVRNVTNVAAAAYAANRGAVPTWNETYREATFSYVESYEGPDPSLPAASGARVRCNVYRTVWFQDQRAIFERVKLAQTLGIGGVALWSLGFDNDLTWQAIAAGQNGTDFKMPDPLPAVITAPNVVAPPYPSVEVADGPLPARFLDTRSDGKTIDNLFQRTGSLKARDVLELQIAGRGPVPGGTTAVAMNVTVIGGGDGFVTVYPCGTMPTTSNLNVKRGQVISNAVLTRLSSSGTICFFSQSPADLVVDVFSVLPDSAVRPLSTPARLLDTRGEPTVDGLPTGVGQVATNTMVEVQVAGRGGLASTAKSAILNVTAVNAAGNGFLTVWPCDSTRPTTSNVNFTRSAPIPNAVVTALSTRGTVCVFASNATDVVIDVFGELDPSNYSPLPAPARLMETRSGLSTIDGQANALQKRTPGVTTLAVAGRGGLGASPGAVILNVTVDAPEAPGFITVYPCDAARPIVSNVNYAAGQTLPNLVVTKLSASGTVCLFNSSTTHVVVDVFGSLTLPG